MQITNDVINEIIELLKKGWTSDEIATEVDLPWDMVDTILARKGL